MALFQTETLNREFGSMCFTAGGLAIHGTDTENLLTANAITYTLGNKFYSKAATAALDLSAICTYADGGSLVIVDGETAEVVIMLDSAGTFSAYLKRASELGWAPADGKVVCGKVEIANATGSDFTVGTTGLDTAGVTDTYSDLCRYMG